MAREEQLTDAFVHLADTLVSDYDVTELLHSLAETCVTVLEVAAAGILLTDQRGSLQLMASSSEQSRLLELFQLQTDDGPCLEAFSTGRVVAVSDLSAAAGRWPAFVPAAAAAGFRGVHAVPMRLRSDTIGALNLFAGAKTGELSDSDIRLAQAMADVATIGILQERAISRSEVLIEQLQGALNSRIVIEQAKGILAEHAGIGMDEAFTRLRSQSRSTNTRLADLARRLIVGELDPGSITAQRLPAGGA